MKSNQEIDKHLVITILLSLAFIGFWLSRSIYLYQTFSSSYADLGVNSYAFYTHIYYPNIISGLQFLIFANHISLFSILLLLPFSLISNPMTIIALQDIALALTSIIIYLCCKHILKNKTLGVMFAVAFLINPGIMGLTFFDYHIEAFIPLFLILAFYFYARDKNTLFLISYVFLLSVIETAWPIGISLILGLLLYEHIYNERTHLLDPKSKTERYKILLAAFVLTVIAVLFYAYITNSLLNLYRQGEYSNMPPSLKLVNFLSYNLNWIASGKIFTFNAAAIYSGIFGLVVLFVGFGLAPIRNTLLSIILIGPWLFLIIFLQYSIWSSISLQYYAYGTGGAIIASILCLSILFTDNKKLPRIWIRLYPKLTLVLALLLSTLIFTLNLYPPSPNLTVYQNSSNIENLLHDIPTNATILVQPEVYPHLSYILNLELPPIYAQQFYGPGGTFINPNLSTYWLKPTYIVYLPSLSTLCPQKYLNSSNFSTCHFANSTYALYESKYGFYIYKLNQT